MKIIKCEEKGEAKINLFVYSYMIFVIIINTSHTNINLNIGTYVIFWDFQKYNHNKRASPTHVHIKIISPSKTTC